MNLIEQARLDVLQITTNADEFAVPVLFTAPDTSTALINARPNKHSLSIDPDTGGAVNQKKVTLSVSEYALVVVGYKTRNDRNDVALIGHVVEWKDSTGLVSKYVIRETWPDGTLGLIVCMLGDFK